MSLITKQMAEEAVINLSTAHSRLCRGRTAHSRLGRERSIEDALKPIRVAETRQGKPCIRCGNTLKYKSNGNCIMHNYHDVIGE